MKKLFVTRNLVLMAIFAALAAVLMLLEFPLPFIAPSFYEIDLSEIPVLIGSFIMGPVAGVIIEAVKILLMLLIRGTDTAYVGELANFIIGCCFIVPASVIYKKNKTKKCLKDLSSVSSTHIRQLTTTCNSSSRRSYNFTRTYMEVKHKWTKIKIKH